MIDFSSKMKIHENEGRISSYEMNPKTYASTAGITGGLSHEEAVAGIFLKVLFFFEK